MSEFVLETDIHYYEILRRGGANGGNENFAFIMCPHCHNVYLIDYEVDTAYLDGNDLSKRVRFFDPVDIVQCVTCSYEMLATDIWKALRHDPNLTAWQADWRVFELSPWAWAVKRRAEDKEAKLFSSC